MDFPTRTCVAGGPSDSQGHPGPMNPGTEGPGDPVQTAFTEDVDLAWQTDGESFPAEPEVSEHHDPAVTRRMPGAPRADRLEGVSA